MKESIDKLNELKNSFDSIEVPPEVDFVIENAIKRGKKTKKNKYIKPMSAIAACLVFAVGIAYSVKTINNSELTQNNNSKLSEERVEALLGSSVLPGVDNYSNLKSLLSDFTSNDKRGYGFGIFNGIAKDKGAVTGAASETAMKSAAQDTVKSEASNTHSSTNVQVEGVDEDDVVKTDGEYIYKISGNKAVIIKAFPAEDMKETASIDLGKDSYAYGIYIKGNFLNIISSVQPNTISNNVSSSEKKRGFFPLSGDTKLDIYDITNKTSIKKVKSVVLSGNYVSSRMIGNSIYMVSNKMVYTDMLKGDNDDIKPYFRDSSVGDKEVIINYDKIKYLPNAVEPNFINIACINLQDVDKETTVKSFLGSANDIYMSDKNMYIAGMKSLNKDDKEMKTTIYKFSLDKNDVKFTSVGEVEGTVLNQFSMDEKDDYFRIATTRRFLPPSSSNGTNSSVSNKDLNEKMTNNLYVLDKDMKVVGKVEDIAPSEQIYSVRFMGDRAYMVTFKLMDPLFVIDLKNPTSPKILGQLKIPGFSTYLHPYDETHIIGFGYDSKLINEGGEQRAQTLGMKLAIFDVSDVSHPIQQFTENIGGKGTYSEVLDNHKALLFDKDKNLLSFPVNVMSYNETTYYSKFEFQGAYVYGIDLNKGFVLKGKITHADKGVNAKELNPENYINRILYIDNTLYTLSNSKIKANDINTLNEIEELKIKEDDR